MKIGHDFLNILYFDTFLYLTSIIVEKGPISLIFYLFDIIGSESWSIRRLHDQTIYVSSSFRVKV